ncbi:phage tail fiber protein [Mycolicibacterium nivoides]|uniref:Minor tail protein n=1 Tax=Mycolicibacterium nivoides TaxID=2487344 RepID=A0ABW9LBA8_9MYCO
MALTPAAHQDASNAIANGFTWISVHTGAGGGTTGANEATGGSYARKQIPGGTWAPNGSGLNTGGMVNIPVPAGTYTEGGLWSASTAGTFRGSGPFGASVVVTGASASIDITPTVSA